MARPQALQVTEPQRCGNTGEDTCEQCHGVHCAAAAPAARPCKPGLAFHQTWAVGSNAPGIWLAPGGNNGPSAAPENEITLNLLRFMAISRHYCSNIFKKFTQYRGANRAQSTSLVTQLWGIRRLAWLKIFLVTWFVLLWPSQTSADIGTVIGLKQGAKILRAGSPQTVRTGMGVASGDTIKTDGSGLVQMVFTDGTKIAIGSNATMVVDVTMLRGNRKAKSFAVQALGGSFRFISGNSRKKAYSIRTPTATMAVRGTIFDLWVVSRSQSAMLVLDGTVQLCGLNGGCRSTGRQCSMLATTSQGAVGQPANQETYDNALRDGFPFVTAQEPLLAPLQVDVGGCAQEVAPIKIKHSDAKAPRRTRTQSAGVAAAAAPKEKPPPEPTKKQNKSGHQDGSIPGGQSKNKDGFGNPGKGKTNRSGQGDGTNPGGQSRNAGGTGNPGKGTANRSGGKQGARTGETPKDNGKSENTAKGKGRGQEESNGRNRGKG
ncbi:conserved hypothetical protein [Ruegeria lacuscaerulensis ITI-1157]|nr:conserved hypothetical protein [Ruegeria lacuscaerulensis ITI-1157]